MFVSYFLLNGIKELLTRTPHPTIIMDFNNRVKKSIYLLPRKGNIICYFLIFLRVLTRYFRTRLRKRKICWSSSVCDIAYLWTKEQKCFSKQTFSPNFSSREKSIPLPFFLSSSSRHDAATGDVAAAGAVVVVGGCRRKSAAGEIIRSKIYPPLPYHPRDARGDGITASRYRGKFRVNDSVIVFQEFPVWTSGR